MFFVWVFFIIFVYMRIGDRVISKGFIGGLDFTGQYGTVKYIGSPNSIGIEWDRPVKEILNNSHEGHDCYGQAKIEHGWYAAESDLNCISNDFRVGDKIIGKGIVSEVDMTGQRGTIKHIEESWDDYSVEWDVQIKDISKNSSFGHDCDGYTKNGYGWTVKKKNLEHENTIYTSINYGNGTALASSNGMTFGKLGHGITDIGGGRGLGGIPTGILSGLSGLSNTSSKAYFEPVESFSQSIERAEKERQLREQMSKINIKYDPRTFEPIKVAVDSDWAMLTSFAPPSPYEHKEPAYVGKMQQFNAIVHTKPMDDFLLLNL